MRRLCLLVVSVLVASAPAGADYILTPLCGGSSSATVWPGEAFDLEIAPDSNQADVHVSAIFTVVFSSPGLPYLSCDWAEPYTENGLGLDDSDPPLASLPVLLVADTLAGAGYEGGLVDIALSNVPDGGGATETFGTGRLVTLALAVPGDYAGPDPVTITVEPDTFGQGFVWVGDRLEHVTVPTGGGSFDPLLPEPATISLLDLGARLPVLGKKAHPHAKRDGQAAGDPSRALVAGPGAPRSRSGRQ
jgi:hypothetical protein